MRKKTCSKCGKDKDIVSQAYCKDCRSDYASKYFADNKVDVSAYHKKHKKKLKELGMCTQSCGNKALADNFLCAACVDVQIWNKIRNKFGITKEEWVARLVLQGNVCALCKRPGTMPGDGNKGGDGYCVDHDHETGAVRGILHGRCNSGLGYFRDDPQLTRAATEYLETTPSSPRSH